MSDRDDDAAVDAIQPEPISEMVWLEEMPDAEYVDEDVEFLVTDLTDAASREAASERAEALRSALATESFGYAKDATITMLDGAGVATSEPISGLRIVDLRVTSDPPGSGLTTGSISFVNSKGDMVDVEVSDPAMVKKVWDALAVGPSAMVDTEHSELILGAIKAGGTTTTTSHGHSGGLIGDPLEHRKFGYPMRPEPTVTAASGTSWPGITPGIVMPGIPAPAWTYPPFTAPATYPTPAAPVIPTIPVLLEMPEMKQVNFRATAELRKKLKVAAAQTDLTVAEYIAQALARVMEEDEVLDAVETSETGDVDVVLHLRQQPAAVLLGDAIRLVRSMLAAKGWGTLHVEARRQSGEPWGPFTPIESEPEAPEEPKVGVGHLSRSSHGFGIAHDLLVDGEPWHISMPWSDPASDPASDIRAMMSAMRGYTPRKTIIGEMTAT